MRREPHFTFEVCGGLTNQRIALVNGLLIGHLTRRAVVLPMLNPNGKQNPMHSYAEDRSHMAPFDAFFDRNATSAALSALGIRCATVEEAQKPERTELPLHEQRSGEMQHRQEELHGHHRWQPQSGLQPQTSGRGQSRPTLQQGEERGKPHELHVARTHNVLSKLRQLSWFMQFRSQNGPAALHFGCTFAAVDLSHPRLQQLFWEIDAALVFASPVKVIAQRIVAELRKRALARGSGEVFNALHLRVEHDWQLHCTRWETHVGDQPRDNCMRNTDNIKNVLRLQNVSSDPPLYVAGELSLAAASRTTRGLSELVSPPFDSKRRYALYSKETLVPDVLNKLSYARSRDVLAAIDFAVCSMAHTFVGNSVSTFAAYQLVQRERRRSEQLGASEGFHYNGGDIPLRSMLFDPVRIRVHGRSHISDASSADQLRRLKWVFAVNGNMRSYDDMAKVAVVSAQANTTLIPVCVFTGRRNALSRWLEGRGVIMIYHEPIWRSKLIAGLARARQAERHPRLRHRHGRDEGVV